MFGLNHSSRKEQAFSTFSHEKIALCRLWPEAAGVPENRNAFIYIDRDLAHEIPPQGGNDGELNNLDKIGTDIGQ